MSFYWIKTKPLIKKIFSNYIWDLPNTEKKIYLTFDDGPTPEITEWVLEELKKHQAKATFFCIGKNIEKYPSIFSRTINEGHLVGNHTFNHLNGWKNSTDNYIDNVKMCQTLSDTNYSYKLQAEHCKLFRPPYGKIKTAQSEKLRQLGYKIIMWDVLSADFDQTVTPEKCLENVLSNVKTGSIIVFHDSVKAFRNLKYTLPKSIEILKKRGFVFDVIQ